MGRRPLLERRNFSLSDSNPINIWGISHRFQWLSPSPGQVTYVLLTRSPLSPQTNPRIPFDLHALGTPLAFILSQDQTLHKKELYPYSNGLLFKQLIKVYFRSYHFSVVKVLVLQL